jgi:hypothetical protein
MQTTVLWRVTRMNRLADGRGLPKMSLVLDRFVADTISGGHVEDVQRRCPRMWWGGGNRNLRLHTYVTGKAGP